MGLELTDGTHSIRVGTYTSVHVHRRLACLAFLVSDATEAEKAVVIQWLPDTPTAQIARDDLKASIPGAVPAYDNMPTEVPPDASDLLCGLWFWVFHSDCDGEHTVDEVADVGLALTRLTAAAKQVAGENETVKWLDRVAKFYVIAAAENREVEFVGGLHV